MKLDKKILVLKQVEKKYSLSGKTSSGIFRFESDSGTGTIFLSVVNLSFQGDGYYLGVLGDGELRTFNLGTRPSSFTQNLCDFSFLSPCISVGIYSVKDFLPTLILFGSNKDDDGAQKAFRRAVADKCYLEKKRFDKENENATISSPEFEFKNENCAVYDDEAVATENYYDISEEINEKITKIGAINDEILRFENIACDCGNEKETEKEELPFTCFQNEKTTRIGSDGEKPYYQTAKPELDKLFMTFPPCDALAGIFPDSRFVRINYSEKDYYVVGVVNEFGVPKYICYGVPAVYSPTPPKELEGYCSFIPLSIFSLDGDGFWMMFQDAVTGESIKKHYD